jgi:hypothetical protein
MSECPRVLVYGFLPYIPSEKHLIDEGLMYALLPTLREDSVGLGSNRPPRQNSVKASVNETYFTNRTGITFYGQLKCELQ